ncbi:MAG: hypothetical protein ACI9UA_005912 [Pseudoalteromonas tetraodonis]|jgi:hypothetical protein
MCTVSWCHQFPGSYALFFNRDESKTRLPATPPRVQSANGVEFITPADGDHGGTWLLANAHGLSVGILNHYAASETYTPDKPTSRGHLVLSLADAHDPQAVAENLASIDPAPFRPFVLFAVSPSDALLWIWDGKRLRTDSPRLPLTTSSYRTDEVVASRRLAFANLRSKTPESLAYYHESHDPERPKFSIRLRRQNTQTVSLSRIKISPREVTYTYRPEPDESLAFGPAARVSIPRLT